MSNNTFYKLEGKKIVACGWQECMEEKIKKDQRVAVDILILHHGPHHIKISTVFLGINHEFGDDKVPKVFETMIFGGGMDRFCERYSTWQDAERGHRRIIQRIEARGEYFFISR
jgi:hypothetical protein